MKTSVCAAVLVVIATLTGCSSGGGSQPNPPSPATVTSIQVAPNSMSIGMGATQQFTATAHLSDNSTKDITSSAQWSSSDSSIASITSAGVATGSASGTVTITAQSTTFKSTATLTVSSAAANLVSIAISPAASSMPVNTTQQFTATGSYSDGSSADLTVLVTWSSSSTATATVSATG
jgi:uncharacterized protein YjdB